MKKYIALVSGGIFRDWQSFDTLEAAQEWGSTYFPYEVKIITIKI